MRRIRGEMTTWLEVIAAGKDGERPCAVGSVFERRRRTPIPRSVFPRRFDDMRTIVAAFVTAKPIL